MIIDSHVHYGKSLWGDFSPEYLLNIVNESVDVVICSNLEGIDSPEFKYEQDCNEQMLQISKKILKLSHFLYANQTLLIIQMLLVNF